LVLQPRRHIEAELARHQFEDEALGSHTAGS
jgi:hypothetical protein